MEFNFGMQINIEVFYKLTLSFCVCMCVFVFMSIRREDLICLNQLVCQGTDQQCCVEGISFLCQATSLL